MVGATYSPTVHLLYLQNVAQEHGLILVDTKYEFGKASDGTILLVDEVSAIQWSIFVYVLSLVPFMHW